MMLVAFVSLALWTAAAADNSLLSALAGVNVSDPLAAETLCRDDLARVEGNTSRAAFLMARNNATALPSGCYFFCEIGKRSGLVPKVMSTIPWNGMCFSSDGGVINRFGPWGKACPRLGWKAIRGRAAVGPSLADPRADAIISRYDLALKPMRYELRDAGHAAGYAHLAGTWLGAYFMDGFELMWFAMLPVICNGATPD